MASDCYSSNRQRRFKCTRPTVTVVMATGAASRQGQGNPRGEEVS